MPLVPIDLRRVKPTAKSAAGKAFKTWARALKPAYPDNRFEPVSRLEPRDDLLRGFRLALRSLLEIPPDHRPKNNHTYVLGFVEGYLNTTWFARFVANNSQTYRDEIFFKSLELFFDSDPECLTYFNRLNKFVIDSNFPFNGELRLPRGEGIRQQTARIVADMTLEEVWEKARTLLSDIMIQRFEQKRRRAFDRMPNFRVELADFFSPETIDKLVRDNQMAS